MLAADVACAKRCCPSHRSVRADLFPSSPRFAFSLLHLATRTGTRTPLTTRTA